MRVFSKQLLWVSLMSAIFFQLMGCSAITFLPTQIPSKPISPFYDQMMDFKSSLKSDPHIGNLHATYDSNYSGYTAYRESYQLDGKFKGRRFSLHQSRTERRVYHEPEWIPVRMSEKGNKSHQWLFVRSGRLGYWETWRYHDSYISMSVFSGFGAKISGEGFFSWIRKKLLRRSEVITGIGSIDEAYFIESDEEGMVKRFLQHSTAQKNLQVLKKNDLLPLQISRNEIKIGKGCIIDTTDTTKYLSALNNIAMLLERISYLEMPDRCP